ncbi:DUF2975 domain-containing protein [Roseospira marina]|uniref:DUF2975 domain-containing protein n=1 Tax=Roseospira marina TaxID=140057 RepID=A0A5M6ID38_9PROT|nr:DUF2975 domain-containing protein [Roseospira marina]KAA5605877.1 DUF2975 domain-containing protein [Roseospira marina]MBB4313698.1 hypothetical protein [Roseospira marina]MBB5086860.1 putative membrane protein [Roseospira marina]
MRNLDHIRRLSHALRLVVALGIVAFIAMPALLWSEPVWLRTTSTLSEHMPATLAVWQQWVGGAVATAGGLVGVWMLSALWRLFGLYGQGRIFERDNVLALRRFGLGLIAYALTSVVLTTLLVLILTMTAPVGQRILEVTVDHGQVSTLILGSVFLVIARVMDEGRLLREEQATII